MTGFNAGGHRRTRLFGTAGELEGDGETVRVHDFLTQTTEVPSASTPGDATAAGGHGGGDRGLMDAFVRAVATGDPSSILTGPRESLSAHLAVFAPNGPASRGWSSPSPLPEATLEAVFLQVAAGSADHNRETTAAPDQEDQMSCTKATPVITMEKLCEPKLRCSVCDRAREARALSGDHPASPDPTP
jgi:hypothetical protein